MEEALLIQKLQSGDTKAFDYLISTRGKKILNICFRFLRQQQDAEDITQEIFITIFHSIHKFNGASGIDTWIYRIAVAKCLDELKKRKRKKRWAELIHGEWVPNFLQMASPELSPYEKVETGDHQKKLQRTLDKLTENQRIVFTLSRVEGFSLAEISTLLKISEDAAESLLRRARKKIVQTINKKDFM